MPAIFSAVIRFKKKFPKHLISGVKTQYSTNTAKGQQVELTLWLHLQIGRYIFFAPFYPICVFRAAGEGVPFPWLPRLFLTRIQASARKGTSSPGHEDDALLEMQIKHKVLWEHHKKSDDNGKKNREKQEPRLNKQKLCWCKKKKIKIQAANFHYQWAVHGLWNSLKD